jgi:hypothetical protein
MRVSQRRAEKIEKISRALERGALYASSGNHAMCLKNVIKKAKSIQEKCSNIKS